MFAQRSTKDKSIHLPIHGTPSLHILFTVLYAVIGSSYEFEHVLFSVHI